MGLVVLILVRRGGDVPVVCAVQVKLYSQKHTVEVEYAAISAVAPSATSTDSMNWMNAASLSHCGVFAGCVFAGCVCMGGAGLG